MKSNIKILVVEDVQIALENLVASLEDLGYSSILTASNSDDALQLIEDNSFDLALLDIGLRTSNEDGISIAESINMSNKNTRIIFTTSFSDRNTLLRTERVIYDNYLIKPISERQLFVSIEKALGETNEERIEIDVEHKALYVKGKEKYFHRVPYANIIYIESDKTGIYIYTDDHGYFFSYNNLLNILKTINSKNIIRIHRSYAVNIDKVEKITDREVVINKDMILPIGQTYKTDVSKYFLKLKTKSV